MTVSEFDDFCQFALANNLAIAPILAGQKTPSGIVANVYNECSRDPAQWQRWATENPGCNWCLPAGPNNLAIVDIDVKADTSGIAAWHAWCAQHGHYAPTWITPSGGAHVLFRLPAGTDPARLRQPQLAPGIDTRAAYKSYVLCPPSRIGAGRYLLQGGPIYDAPAGLLKHVLPETPAVERSAPKVGQYDKGDTAALLKWLVEHGEFEHHDDWFKIGAALKLSHGDDGLELWRLTHNETVTPHVEATKWNSFASEPAPNSVTLNTFMAIAHAAGWTGQLRRSTEDMFGNVAGAGLPAAPSDGANLEDFIALLSQNLYCFIPTRELWSRAAVNAALPKVQPPVGLPIQPATWLDKNRPTHQVAWAPGKPLEIKDRLFDNGAWVERAGCNTLNLYKPPNIVPKVGDASLWVNHVHRLYPDEAEHLILWFAHRVKRPGEKINHAVVMGGAQGIGKDTILEAVKAAVGAGNFGDVNPSQLMGRFNAHLSNVILRINETRDKGDTDRVGFYEHSKTICAAPPDVHRVDEKHVKEYNVMNVVGPVITTNSRDSLFLPPDDRRYFVAWSTLEKTDFSENYWREFYAWLGNGGKEIVAHYLGTLDLSAFDPKAPPPKTRGWSQIVRSSCSPDDSDMRDALERLNNPPAVTVDMLAAGNFGDWLRATANRRRIPHRFEACGYVEIENPYAKDGRWRIGTTKHMVYARKDLSIREQSAAAAALTPGAIEAIHKAAMDRAAANTPNTPTRETTQ